VEFRFNSGSSSLAAGRSTGGKGCLTVFFLIFLTMGSIFTIFILGETVRETAVWFWPEVPCIIISTGVGETGDDQEPYTTTVVFEYEIDGKTYRGNKIARNPSTGARYDTARDAADRYSQGSRTICRVHPEIPGEAVLERRWPLIVFITLFPLIFVAIGAGGIWGVWRADGRTTAGGAVVSISERARKNRGKTIGLFIGILFATIGGIGAVFLLVVPLIDLAKASTWIETPATVVGSTLRSWSTDDGTSYRADVLYEYTIDRRTWRSNRRIFFPLGSGDSDGARSVLSRYPEGTALTCFVDPSDPSRSVLERGFRPLYLIGLFPLFFLVAGLALTAHTLRKGASTRAAARRPATGIQPEGTAENEATLRILEPEAGPLTKVIGAFIFAAIWNGIVSVFLWQVVQSFRRGEPEWFLTLFMTPFMLVGLGAIVAVFYFLLAAANPRPQLQISPASPRLGSKLRIEWGFTGNARRISRLKIVLEGHEKATYQRGTDTHTDRQAFVSIPVIESESKWELAKGVVDLEIPDDTMHSFTSEHNAVVWAIHVHGNIPQWPDVNDSFEIDVRPLSRAQLLP